MSCLFGDVGEMRFEVKFITSAAKLICGVVSLAFGVITGTIFGFYPAYKASTLIPVVALNQE